MAKQKFKQRQLSAQQCLEIAERELAKGEVKDALGKAKGLFRQNAGEAERALLERCFAARIDQLLAAGLVEPGRTQLQELLQFQPRTPEVVAAIPRWRLLLGQGSPTELDCSDPVLIGELVDIAIRQREPQRVPNPRTRAETGKVLEALAAIEAGRDEEAETMLREIPRNSPCADWRLFARGLSAFHAADLPRAVANWERLDVARAANRIAQTLLVAQGHRTAEQANIAVGDRVRRFRNGLLGGSVRHDLDQFVNLWNDQRRKQAIQCLAELVRKNGPQTERIASSLREFVWKHFAEEGDLAGIETLVKALPGPPLDPHWNRARGLAVEDPRAGGPEIILKTWTAYLQDVERLDLPPESKDWIAALVHHRVGAQLMRAFPNVRGGDESEESSPLSEGDQWFFDRADAAFAEATRRCPALRMAYADWASLLLRVGKLAQAAQVYERMVEQFPDSWTVHLWLAEYYADMDDLPHGLPRLAALERLRPRDPATEALRWSFRVSEVRSLAKERRLAEARAEAGRLAESLPRAMPAFHVAVIQAAIEYKAKDVAAAETFVQAAISQASSSALVALALAHAASQFGIHRDSKRQIEGRLALELDQPLSERAAGGMCQYLHDLLRRNRRYRGIVSHCKAVRSYLDHRSAIGKLAWEAADLRAVCRFLLANSPDRAERLLRPFAACGMTKFPRDPLFPFAQAVNSLRTSRFGYDSTAQRNGEIALSLNQSATNQSANESLTDDELRELRERLDRQSRPDWDLYYGRDDDFDEYEYEDEEPDDDDVDEAHCGFGQKKSGSGRQREFDFGFPNDFQSTASTTPEGALGNAADNQPMSDEMIDEMMRTMPPILRGTLESIAKLMGESEREALIEALRKQQLGELP